MIPRSRTAAPDAASALILIGVITGFASTTVEQQILKELNDLEAMTTWEISKPGWGWPGDESCGIGDHDRYARVRLDHEVSSALDNATATREINTLDRRVVRFLTSRGWARMDLGPDTGEIPNGKRCYRKHGTIVQVYQTTSRCTMNTPCTAYDGFAINLYLPRK